MIAGTFCVADNASFHETETFPSHLVIDEIYSRGLLPFAFVMNSASPHDWKRFILSSLFFVDNVFFHDVYCPCSRGQVINCPALEACTLFVCPCPHPRPLQEKKCTPPVCPLLSCGAPPILLVIVHCWCCSSDDHTTCNSDGTLHAAEPHRDNCYA